METETKSREGGRGGRSWGESWQIAKCPQILLTSLLPKLLPPELPLAVLCSLIFSFPSLNSLVIQNKCSRLSPVTQLSLSSEMGE